MNLMGITNEILEHYIKETGFFPLATYSDQIDDEFQSFTTMLSTWFKGEPFDIQLVNYRGEKFTAK